MLVEPDSRSSYRERQVVLIGKVLEIIATWCLTEEDVQASKGGVI